MRVRPLSTAVVGIALALCSLLAVATPATAAPTKKGQTVVTLDPGLAAALTGLGVSVGVVRPAYGKDGGVAFPIVGNPSRGVVKHVGGLSLSAGDTVVTLTNYWIDGAVVTGVVNGGDRLPLFDVTAPGGVVTLDLTDVAAGALDGIFGTDALSGSTVVGTADIQTP
jgi:hypothetical protein